MVSNATPELMPKKAIANARKVHGARKRSRNPNRFGRAVPGGASVKMREQLGSSGLGFVVRGLCVEYARQLFDERPDLVADAPVVRHGLLVVCGVGR